MVGAALLVLLAVQLRQQRLHRVGVALGDEHGLPHLHIVRHAAVVIHPQLIQVLCLAAACLRLKERDALRAADEQIRLDLQVQALIQVLLRGDPQNARFRRLFLRQHLHQHLLAPLLLDRLGDVGANPAEQRRHLRVILTQAVFRRLGIGQRCRLIAENVDLGEKAVLTGVQGLPPDLAAQPMLNGTAVDSDLRAAGGHVALVIEGVFLAAADAAVAAADGHGAVAQIGLHRGQLGVPTLSLWLQRLGDLHAIGNAILVHGGETNGEGPVPQQVGVGVAQGLLQVGHHLREGGVILFGDGLEGQELMHGAANLHHRTAIAHNVPAAGNKIHGHTDAVGAFHPLVAVMGGVLRRPGLDAPMLVCPGVDGRQRVLETHAVLVQGGLGAGTGGNGERCVHVLNAGAVVADRDIHIGVLVHQRDFDAPPDIVGAEIGDGVVGQFAEGLAEFLEVAGDAREEFSTVGGVVGLSNDGFAHNLFLLKNVF